ncbi:hypothetical protein P153DRAFT_361923 [Dothidotthia symphoricarpi CBS 119687]|uniref:Uncharacterized protein n=1 Tax=Dothidotthia symphoricarpi CBS 119687 TaxID=1392245 RepID=A0A6A5ZXU7_9PLEO|nr:uncharacterized protein P153DRAFT_361923 [Dothidotthia symphoricarpi CBS 119687]KAF2123597.1 hypothetical protein P153DRAFT_361923 [Dothidotthia symphoricarpi CBS 119687]
MQRRDCVVGFSLTGWRAAAGLQLRNGRAARWGCEEDIAIIKRECASQTTAKQGEGVPDYVAAWACLGSACSSRDILGVQEFGAGNRKVPLIRCVGFCRQHVQTETAPRADLERCSDPSREWAGLFFTEKLGDRVLERVVMQRMKERFARGVEWSDVGSKPGQCKRARKLGYCGRLETCITDGPARSIIAWQRTRLPARQLSIKVRYNRKCPQLTKKVQILVVMYIEAFSQTLNIVDPLHALVELISSLPSRDRDPES